MFLVDCVQNPLLSAGRTKFSKTKKSKTNKNLDQFLTHKTANIGPENNSSAYIVESKTRSKNGLCLSQSLVQVFLFVPSFVFHKSSSFWRGKWDFLRRKDKTIVTLFWVKPWSNYVAQHAWTKFWLNLGPSFHSTFLTFLGHSFPFSNYAETTISIAFSAPNYVF